MRSRTTLSAVLLLCLIAVPALAQQWGRPHPPRMGACFYRDSDFRGDYFCLKVGERWPQMPPGFNDKITSIRVFNGAVVAIFEDGGYSGERMRIDGDVDTLKRFRLRHDPSRNWNDRISSLAVFRNNDDWDRGHRDDGYGPGLR
jgi:hypothetical protein